MGSGQVLTSMRRRRPWYSSPMHILVMRGGSRGENASVSAWRRRRLRHTHRGENIARNANEASDVSAARKPAAAAPDRGREVRAVDDRPVHLEDLGSLERGKVKGPAQDHLSGHVRNPQVNYTRRGSK